jgi:regulator of protease activity HflC (stomatin/prohibitin superfamily)
MLADLIAIAVVTTLLYYSWSFAIRALARIPFRWTFNPANTFALVVTEEDESGSGMKGGGNIVKILHAVPGHRLIDKDPNPMNHFLEKIEEGKDPSHDNFLFQKLGVQDMGSVFFTLRTNMDKRARFTRETDKPTEELHTVTKVNKTQHVFFTGEMTVTIKEADTADKIYLDFEIDFVFERKFPARSVLRVADAPALLTSFVENIVNNQTVSRPVADFYGGEDAKANREELARLIDNEGLKELVERELGLDITSVSIRSVEIDPAYRALFAKKTEAEKNAEALSITVKNAAENTVTTAEADKQAKILRNDAEADHIARVTVPTASSELSVRVREAEAYENNNTVTTFAPGKESFVPISKN